MMHAILPSLPELMRYESIGLPLDLVECTSQATRRPKKFHSWTLSTQFSIATTINVPQIASLSPEHCGLVNDITHISASAAQSEITQEFMMLYHRQN